MAKMKGFELSRACTLSAFQANALDHYATSSNKFRQLFKLEIFWELCQGYSRFVLIIYAFSLSTFLDNKGYN